MLATSGILGVAYVGGVGSGKTIAGCIQAMYMATTYPRSRGVITNNTHPQLRDSTMATFFRLFPPYLFGTMNQQEKIFKLFNGSEIYFRSTSDPDSLLGSNLLWFFMDEASLGSVYAFQTLYSRLKRPEADVVFPFSAYKFWITSNPCGKNWLYKFFFSEEAPKEHYGIVAPSTENIHLDRGHLEQLRSMYGDDLARRFIDASFDSFAGQIFPEFKNNPGYDGSHVIDPVQIPSHWYRFRCIDFGQKNPNAVLWVAESPTGDLYVYREFYKANISAFELGEGIVERSYRVDGDPTSGQEQYEYTIGDTSGAKVDPTSMESVYSQLLEHSRVEVLKAQKQDKFGRINRTKQMLRKNKIFIFRTCSHLIEELPQYQWEPPRAVGTSDTERVLKTNDHAIDALMYLIASRPDFFGLPDSTPAKNFSLKDAARIVLPDEVEDKLTKPKNSYGDLFDVEQDSDLFSTS